MCPIFDIASSLPSAVEKNQLRCDIPSYFRTFASVSYFCETIIEYRSYVLRNIIIFLRNFDFYNKEHKALADMNKVFLRSNPYTSAEHSVKSHTFFANSS